jgi:hypothetical protein
MLTGLIQNGNTPPCLAFSLRVKLELKIELKVWELLREKSYSELNQESVLSRLI